MVENLLTFALSMLALFLILMGWRRIASKPRLRTLKSAPLALVYVVVAVCLALGIAVGYSDLPSAAWIMITLAVNGLLLLAAEQWLGSTDDYQVYIASISN